MPTAQDSKPPRSYSHGAAWLQLERTLCSDKMAMTDILPVLSPIIPTTGLVQFLAITVTVAVVVKWLLFKKKYRLPPGPRPLPVLGNLLELKGTTLWDKAVEWGKAHGPVCTVYLGMSPSIVINSYEALSEAFITKAEDFSNRPYLPSMDYASGQRRDIAFAQFNPVFKQRRKVATQTLRQYMAGNQHTERIKTVVDMAVENILKEIKDNTCRDNTIEHTVVLTKHLNYIIITIAHTLCFGSMLEMDSACYRKVLNFFECISGKFTGFLEDNFHFLRHFPTKAFRTFMSDFDRFQNYIQEQIANERKVFEDHEERNTIVQKILMAEKQADQSEKEAWKEAMNDQTLSNILIDLFFAAIDTTRETLSWIFLVLADKKDIQKKVYEEIEATVGSAPPGREHRQGLVYTEAVIQEVMRLHPVIPMSLPHETARDTKLQNYEIPEKVTVMVNIFGIMRDPKTWENPEEFIPERFIGGNGTRTVVRPPEHIPFSAGPRNCLGEFVARQSLLFIVVNVLQQLELSLEPGVSADYGPDITNFFNFATKPYRVVARKRN